jgi:hypothetical protein
MSGVGNAFAGRHRMLSVMLSLQLAAGPAVWTEPLGPTVLALVSGFAAERYVYVPLGVTIFEPFELSAQGTFYDYAQLDRSDYAPAPYHSRSVMAAIGPVLHAHGGTWLDGFFLQPKLAVQAGQNLTSRLAFGCAELALDAGYQLRAGHFFGALLVGGGVSYGLMPSDINGVFGVSSNTPRARFVFSVNMNFLRLGYAF